MQTFIMLLLVLLCCLVAGAAEGQRNNVVMLNGQWECAVGNGAEGAALPAGQGGLAWKPVELPGGLLPMGDKTALAVQYMWVRRTFQVTKAQASRLAVLHWNRISYGAVAYLNGKRVGEHVTIGPYQVMLPQDALGEGDNTIVLKVTGPAGVARAKSGHMLIPAGFDSYETKPSGRPEIGDDMWIDFADDAYMQWVLAMPDLAHNKVRLRITPVARTPLAGLTITAEVRSVAEGKRLGSAKAPATASRDANPLTATHAFVDVPMPGFQPWTYESPILYTAHVTLSRGNRTLDAVDIRFGMREISVANGHYQLNGKNLWLRGSELVADWNWAPGVKGNELAYLVTEAHEMNINAFRTHTQPPPAKWADICDEHGTMLLAEFPVLYNAADYHFTPEEYQIWHQNVLDDATGWMARLWNHPSVVLWVLSNESNYDQDWEHGIYDDFARGFDPTRPTMRTGQMFLRYGTRDNIDWHPCDNISYPEEGHVLQQILEWRGQRDQRTMTATEYMNIFGEPKCQWCGTQDRNDYAMTYAQLGMEHTEAMRRQRLDAVLPYMYAGWTKTRMGREWKGGFAAPVSAVWHSALSPVLASLDLFDADYLTGQQVTTDLYLINDSWYDAAIHVDLLITKENPEYLPEAACFNTPLAKWSFDYLVRADSLRKMPVSWTLPAEEGSYWLTARTTGFPGRPVLSQRFIRAVKSPEPSPALKAHTLVLLGGDAEATTYFQAHGLKTTTSTAGLTPAEHIVVIWDADKLRAEEKQRAGAICDFAAAGGRVVVLAAKTWTWTALCDVMVDGNCHGSRVFPYEGEQSPALAGISRDMLSRWNGLPGTVAMGVLHEKTGKTLEAAKRIGWVVKPDYPPIADVPAASGTGAIRFALLAWGSHLDRTKPMYDPVAVRVLLQLLQ